MVTLQEAKALNKFKLFKEKYQHSYSEEAWKYIEENFLKEIHGKEAPDILMQVYSELDIYPSPAVFYKRHLELIKKHFPITGNVLEIGSGRIPAFANLLASEQLKLGKGTVTIYEPLLVEMTPKHSNITIHKEEFTPSTDVKPYDLITGILPCDVTETILESAIENQKDFYVAMCGCVHSPLSYFYGFYGTSPQLYQEEVIEKAKSLVKQYDDGELMVTRLKNTEINYPILYNRR